MEVYRILLTNSSCEYEVIITVDKISFDIFMQALHHLYETDLRNALPLNFDTIPN